MIYDKKRFDFFNSKKSDTNETFSTISTISRRFIKVRYGIQRIKCFPIVFGADDLICKLVTRIISNLGRSFIWKINLMIFDKTK